MEDQQILDPEIDAPIDRTPQKKRALGIIIGTVVAMGFAEAIPTLAGRQLAHLIGGIVCQVMMMTWVYFDSIEMEEPIGKGTMVLVFLFGWLVVPFYFLRSRGFRRGMLSIVKAIGLLILLLLIFSILGVAFGPHSPY